MCVVIVGAFNQLAADRFLHVEDVSAQHADSAQPVAGIAIKPQMRHPARAL